MTNGTAVHGKGAAVEERQNAMWQVFVTPLWDVVLAWMSCHHAMALCMTPESCWMPPPSTCA